MPNNNNDDLMIIIIIIIIIIIKIIIITLPSSLPGSLLKSDFLPTEEGPV